MESCEKTRALLTGHFKKYPLLELRDLFKYLYQSAFGCEHMAPSPETAAEYIRRENDATSDISDNEPPKEALIDRLDGGFSRVHLVCLKLGIDAETLGRFFCLSAGAQTNGKDELEKKLSVAREMISDGTLPFSLADFDREMSAWRDLGYPPIHHSDTFRKKYRPAYRVIANEYIDLLFSTSRIDQAAITWDI